MRKEVILIIAAAMLLLLPFVSADISISQPNSAYSFGDPLAASVTVSESSNTNSFLTIDVSCGGNNNEIYKAPLYTAAGDTHTVEINALIDSLAFDGMVGDCELDASYNSETAKTDQFTISNKLLVTVRPDQSEIDPGSAITVTGSAARESGSKVTGTADISIEGTDITKNVDITDGEFSADLSIPDDFAAGDYSISVSAEERDSADNVLNSGNGTGSITVNHVIKEAEIDLSQTAFNPGEDVGFKVKLLDQTGVESSGDVAVSIYAPMGNQSFSSMVVSASEEVAFKTEKNYTAGIWKIEAMSGDITATKEFGINEYASIDARMENNTLVVLNNGNIPYDNEINVTIGDKVLAVKVNLSVGAEERMKLSAPNGEYNVSVGDGSSSNTFTGVSLTGRAIGINTGDGSAFSFTYIFWIIVILVVLSVAVYYFRKVQKSNGFASWKLRRNFGNSSSIGVTNTSRVVSSSVITNAREQIGSRKDVAIVAIKIKNYDEAYSNNSSVPEIIAKAVQTAKDAGATVTSNEASIIAYFADSSGKESKELKAVKTAKEIESLLKSYNRKYAKKVMFGIGVHSDTFIVEVRAGGTQFTPLGTGLSYARKIAENSNEAVLLSDVVHERTRAEVKTDKSIGGLFWNVRAFTARSADHEEFIKRFMKSNKFEDK